MVMNFVRPSGHWEKVWRWNKLVGLIILKDHLLSTHILI